MRTSPIHYIAPSAISIIPNCNSSANDLAVTIARGAKILVYSPATGINTVNGSYQEWTFAGRNRRLADSTAPYPVYVRLPKDGSDKGYLVFADVHDSTHILIRMQITTRLGQVCRTALMFMIVPIY